MSNASDRGTASGRRTPEPDRRLTEIGPGTPMGELLRRADRGVQMVRHRLREMLVAMEADEPITGLASGLTSVPSTAGNFRIESDWSR